MPFDAFISHRRVDGAGVAAWLRRQLRWYQLPRPLRTGRARLAVYLDTSYARATDNFWERNICPALLASRFLIVIATPACLELRPDHTPSWMVREIEAFRGRGPVIIARGKGALEDPLPAGLSEGRANHHIIDLRDAARWWSRWRHRAALHQQVLAIVAALHDISEQDMPTLREEDARRARRRRVMAAATVLALAAAGITAGARLHRVGAEARANELAATGRSYLASDPTRAIDLAGEAYRIAPVAPAARLLLEAYDRAPLYRELIHEPSELSSIAYSPLGDRVLVGAYDNSITLVARSGTPAVSLPPCHNTVSAIVWSPTRGSAFASWDGELRVLDPGGAVTELRDASAVHAIGYLGADELISGDKLGELRRWNLRTRSSELIWKFDSRIEMLEVSRDEQWILAITGSRGQVVDLAEHRVRLAFDGESGRLCPDRSCIAIARDGAISLVSPAGEPIRELGSYAGHLRPLRFSRDGQRLFGATDSGQLLLWDATGGHPQVYLRGAPTEIKDIDVSPSGDRVVAASIDGVVREWTLAGGRRHELRDAPDALPVIVPSPDGELAVANHHDGSGIWRLQDHRAFPLDPTRGPPDLRAAAFPATSEFVVTISSGGSAIKWDREGHRTALLGYRLGELRAVAVSSDGHVVATGNRAGEVRLWTDDRPGAALAIGSMTVDDLALSADGSRVAVAHNGFSIWASGHRECGTQFGSDGAQALTMLALSPRADVVATAWYGEDVARLWTAACAPLTVLRGHHRPITAIAFSARGVIATTSEDETLRLWSIAGAELAAFELRSPGLSLAFTRDGRELLVAMRSGDVERLVVDVDEVLARARAMR